MTTPRYALLGGSFNPPHRAHRALAALALRHLALDTLIVMPAGQPWQKAGTALAAGAHRLAMTRLQMAGLQGVEVSGREIAQDQDSVSADTLAALAAERPGEWFLVIGQDQYARLGTWRRLPQLVAACTLAVAARAEQPVQADPALPAHRRVILPLPADDVSASGVRAALAAGQDVRALVGDEVAGYIAHHSLYGA